MVKNYPSSGSAIKVLLCFAMLVHGVFPGNAQTLYIKAAAYLDVRSGKLVKPANMVVENGLITAVNPERPPAAGRVVELPGKILLPGLMDMHVHLDMDLIPNYPNLLVTENAAKNALRGARNAELTLMAGFTTVRDLGQGNPSIELIAVALAKASDEGWIKATHIIPAGHMIGISGGHADLSMMGGFAEQVMDLGPEYGVANGKEEVLKAVRYQIKYGARVIKIMATAGVMSLEGSAGAQQMTDEEMEAAVQEATRHGITVAAHAHGAQGIMAAIRAGVTSIEHGSFLNDTVIQLMIQKGTYLVPTTGLTDQIALQYDKMDPRLVAKAKYVLPIARKSVTAAIKAGVKICLGTDAPLLPHGQNARELSAMMDRGMSAIEAIRSATINPAAMLKLTDRGEIKEGLLADIIAVDGNPLENIRVLEQVKFVMKGGTIYKQE